jgi:hypothetical protein
MSNGDFWSKNVWTQFNGSPTDKTQPGLLKTTMGPTQVAQQVFNTIVTGNDNSIPADTIIDPGTEEEAPSTGETRTFVTLLKRFQLYPLHVNDPTLTMASNQVTRAAEALALLEERLFYDGKIDPIPPGLELLPKAYKQKLGGGLLGIAKSPPIEVPHKKTSSVQSPPESPLYGLETYKAVVKGIARFTENQQGPPYAVILSPDTFADANFPLEDNAMVTPAGAIQALLASGPFVMSPGMPPKTGLLSSLGGQATTLYIGTGPLVEFNTFDKSVYWFSARESIQFLNTDVRSLIKLDFEK